MRKKIISFILLTIMMCLILVPFYTSAQTKELSPISSENVDFIQGDVIIDGMLLSLPLTTTALKEQGFLPKATNKVAEVLNDYDLVQYVIPNNPTRHLYISEDENGYIVDIATVIFHSELTEQTTYVPKQNVFFKVMDVFGIQYDTSYDDLVSLFDEIYEGVNNDTYIVLDDSNCIILYTMPDVKQSTYPTCLRLHMGDADFITAIRNDFNNGRLSSKKPTNLLFSELGYDMVISEEDKEKFAIESLNYLPTGEARFLVRNVLTGAIIGNGLILPLSEVNSIEIPSIFRIGKTQYSQNPSNVGITDDYVEYGKFYPSHYSSDFGAADMWEILPENIAIIFTTDIEMTYFINCLSFSCDGGKTYYSLSDGSENNFANNDIETSAITNEKNIASGVQDALENIGVIAHNNIIALEDIVNSIAHSQE